MSLEKNHSRITERSGDHEERFGRGELVMSDSREIRIQASLLAAIEKRCLIWLARHMPGFVNSDHLTVLAVLAMLSAGVCYWLAPMWPSALWLVVALLAVNWFGDSLDGTLARVRRQERPHYGFYVDHVLDAVGTLFLVSGLALGGFMSPAIAAGVLLAYYLLGIEIALATHAIGTFRISYWKVGPTELRILLALGTLQLLRSPRLSMLGSEWLLFDVGGAIAIAGLLVTFIASAIMNTRRLYKAEPLPKTSSGIRRTADCIIIA
jgi:archaetidylinositol phosphate synthase